MLTEGWKDGISDMLKTLYPIQTPFCGGYKYLFFMVNINARQPHCLSQFFNVSWLGCFEQHLFFHTTILEIKALLLNVKSMEPIVGEEQRKQENMKYIHDKVL